jgi:hypothetical protein
MTVSKILNCYITELITALKSFIVLAQGEVLLILFLLKLWRRKTHIYSSFFWRHDIQCNDTQHNDIQRNDNQHNDSQHNDIQHNNKLNPTLNIMAQNKLVRTNTHTPRAYFAGSAVMLSVIVLNVLMPSVNMLSIFMLSVICAECYLCWVSLCLVSLC